MLLPTPLLFGVAAGHIGVVIVLTIYSVRTLFQLKCRGITAHKACAKLNVLLPIAVLIHGCSSLMLKLHGYWIPFYCDLLILVWSVYEIVTKNRNEGVYNAKTIIKPGEIDRHIIDNYCRLEYFLVFISIYIRFLIEALKTPIDWNVFNLQKALLFISTTCLTEAVLIILAYSIVTLSNLELDSSRIRDTCQKLNRLLIVKIVIHYVLSCILTVQTSWAFFASNLQIFRFEICKLTSGRGTNAYDPEQILYPGEIHKHRNYYRTCFMYFFVSLGIYTYCIFEGNVELLTSFLLVLLPMLLLEANEMMNGEEGIFSKIRFLFLFSTRQLRDPIVH